jgi:hypothetical protein
MLAAILPRRTVQEPFRAVGMESGAEEASAWAKPYESASGGTVQVLTLRGLAAGAESCGATKFDIACSFSACPRNCFVEKPTNV